MFKGFKWVQNNYILIFMPSIKNETQQINFERARKLLDPLKLNEIVDRISEFKGKIKGMQFDKFEDSKEMVELLNVLDDYQVLNFIAKQIEKMQKTANDDLKEMFKLVNLEQANGLSITTVDESEMVDNDKGRFLVKQLANKDFIVIQMLKSVFDTIFKDIDIKSYKVFNIDTKDYIKMKKGYSKLIDAKETDVRFKH